MKSRPVVNKKKIKKQAMNCLIKPQEEEEPFDDTSSVILLLFLYFLQGLPMGLSGTLDLMLQESGKLSYEEQGVYSAVSWPYSLKLLWAPLVDSLFFKRFGRRKTWLIPVQFLIGFMLLGTCDLVPKLLSEGTENKPQVYELTLLFFGFFVLCATQDIAVDGWALEMLSKKNVAWASTCNSVGLSFGYIVGYQGIMLLRMQGWADISQFMRLSGWGYLVCTVYLAVFRKERRTEEHPESIAHAYSQAWQVCRLKPVRILALALLTKNVAFAAAEVLTVRKLLAAGLKKEVVATVATVLTPLSVILPGVLAKYAQTKPLDIFTKTHIPRMILCILSAMLWVFRPDNFEHLPMLFWCSIFIVSILASVISTTQFVSMMAFFTMVSDPLVGGSYMTALNTIANLGGKWPNTMVLFAINPLTIDGVVDGYYVLVGFGLVFGVAWIWYFQPQLQALTALEESAWRLNRESKLI